MAITGPVVFIMAEKPAEWRRSLLTEEPTRIPWPPESQRYN
ncbi:hypothetical protein ACPOL_1909 [Acidisarcina polymorpha]|uniref:Uncharacterized protein n=1 Tax=Acidisarcina polymorpha TaxID=2211140 RepID=A0A2Z5FXQ4_9BACT|nr:hypothetical protein ACPOL_1909 [Acidisarcina polymorpha]